MHRRLLASRPALALALAGVVWCASGASACESSVTSVGAWEPVVVDSGGAGNGGVGAAGNGGGGAGSGGTSAAAGEAGAAGELSSGGAPEPTGPGLYLEAESAELSSDPNVPDGGWAIIDDAAASNGKYILPPAGLSSGDMHGTALARYSFNLEQDGDYLIWGRIYTPDIASNRFWFQVDGGTWVLWRITVGTIWYWHALHDNMQYDAPMHFHLTAGAHELVIANNVPNARLDKLYVTSFGDTPPGNTTTCRPPHTVDLGGPNPCAPSCGAQAKPNMGTTCACGDRSDTFYAYDCTSTKCCYVQMP